ncbi:hypothetical protein [Streptacidiphilus sp. EB103A]|uniref:hypothetical protein n=1 Tax=Streptacidiphilus sp. EB103A TaxID=3156275 RepID=UPI0035143906
MTDWEGDWKPGTAADLAEDARRLGMKMSARGVLRHVEVGLLAPPLRRKTTQHGSDMAVFPPTQRRLFYEINKAKIRSPLAKVPHHTMVPVVLKVWLEYDGVVTDGQARRALRTHALKTGFSSGPRRSNTVAQVIGQVASPEATAAQLQAAKMCLVEGERSRNPDWDIVAEVLYSVANPWRSRGCPIEIAFGPPQAPMTTDQMVASWESTWSATQRLEFESVSEPFLRRVRDIHREDWAEYLRLRPQLQADAGSRADMFTLPGDPEVHARQQVNGFVSSLAGNLGLSRDAAQRAEARRRRR